MGSFIAMLSKRIQIRSSTTAVSGQNNEGELFHRILPYFVWLLRDAMLAIPSDCTDLKDYFLKKVRIYVLFGKVLQWYFPIKRPSIDT